MMIDILRAFWVGLQGHNGLHDHGPMRAPGEIEIPAECSHREMIESVCEK